MKLVIHTHSLLNLPMYINLFLLLGIVLMAVSALVDNPSHAFNSLILEYLHIDLHNSGKSMNIIDSISLTALIGLFIGIMGTVPGHELVHRKKKNLTWK